MPFECNLQRYSAEDEEGEGGGTNPFDTTPEDGRGLSLAYTIESSTHFIRLSSAVSSLTATEVTTEATALLAASKPRVNPKP